MKKMTILFWECEHDGDLSNYLDDIRKSGGKIIDWDLDYDAEEASVNIRANNDFLERFKKTVSFKFSEFAL